MIWKPGDCYTMTVPLHTAGLLSPKCRVDAGLGAGRQPDWILDRICGKKVVNAQVSRGFHAGGPNQGAASP